MNKLSVVGLESEKAPVMEDLQKLGMVEFNDQSEKLQDPEWTAIIRRDSEEDQVSRLESELAEVQTVLDTIARYDTERKPLFHMRKQLTESEYDAMLGDGSGARARVSELFSLYESWNDQLTLENNIVSSQAALQPWMSYDLPLELTATRSVRVLYGVIPAVADGEALKKQVDEVSDATVVSILGSDQEQQYLSVLCMLADEEAITDVLKSFGFTPASFKDMTGTASENMTRLGKQLEEVRAKVKELEEQFRVPVDDKVMLRAYADSLQVDLDRAKTSEKLLRTRTSYYFDGWVPEENQKEVEAVLEEYGCYYEIEEPEKGEETPVKLKENSFVYPLQSITELYALPKSYEVDPTPIFAVFYIIFFGMMFADVAYGLILAGLCFFALKHYRLEGMSGRLVTTLIYCGISTAVWGLLFGGFFGDLIEIKPLWMSPLDNPMTILIFSCVLGVVHLFVGMGVDAYMKIRNGHVFDAICDDFAWYVFILGLALLIVAFFGVSLFPSSTTVGAVMAIAGAVWIVGCEFIRGKGVRKLLGLWNLYGTTSYLADVLSYSRLLALGLASAVIAQVFNMLGGMLGTGIVGLIGFIVVAVIGHTVNFAINALGSFVHASRLQYVEFFGKFYEGGGVPFAPLERKTKYIKLVKEEN